MEIEQPTSKFQKVPEVMMVSTSSNDLASQTSSYKSVNRFSKFFSKIISDVYRIIDSLSGSSSYFLLNSPSDFYQQSLVDVFQLLRENGFIGDYIFSDERYNDAPAFYRLDIFPSYPQEITDGNIVKKPMGHGFGREPKEVFSKTIGEFLERYFLTLYYKKDLLHASLNDLKNKRIPALDLNLLAGFSPEQKKFSKFQFNGDSIFWWRKAKRYSTNENFYLPAQLIHWNYNFDELEPFLCEPNTNGAGGMFSKEEAISVGIYELIQRDSFLIYWLNQLAPQKIDPHSIPFEPFQNLLLESERYGFEIHCLNITADIGVPTFVVVVSDPSGESPRFCVGGGCQADPIKALYRALEEAWSVYYWMRPLPPFPALKKDYRPFRAGISQEERLRLWSNPEMAKYFEFFISGDEKDFSEITFDYPVSFSSPREELNFLIKRIESHGAGYEVYYYESQHPFLHQIGYYSAQVVIPQFIPLYLNEFYAPLGSLRLKEVPKKLGLKVSRLNLLPHPFP